MQIWGNSYNTIFQRLVVMLLCVYHIHKCWDSTTGHLKQFIHLCFETHEVEVPASLDLRSDQMRTHVEHQLLQYHVGEHHSNWGEGTSSWDLDSNPEEIGKFPLGLVHHKRPPQVPNKSMFSLHFIKDFGTCGGLFWGTNPSGKLREELKLIQFLPHGFLAIENPVANRVHNFHLSELLFMWTLLGIHKKFLQHLLEVFGSFQVLFAFQQIWKHTKPGIHVFVGVPTLKKTQFHPFQSAAAYQISCHSGQSIIFHLPRGIVSLAK